VHVARSCVESKEPSGSIKYEYKYFLDGMRKYCIFNKDSVQTTYLVIPSPNKNSSDCTVILSHYFSTGYLLKRKYYHTTGRYFLFHISSSGVLSQQPSCFQPTTAFKSEAAKVFISAVETDDNPLTKNFTDIISCTVSTSVTKL
jgi:hypothetical protein